MNTTISFNHEKARNYANELFIEASREKTSYQVAKRTEAIMIMIGIDTGFRISDILNLKYHDISIDNEFGKPFITGYVHKKKRNETKPLTSNTLRHIETFKNWLLSEYGYTNDLIFYNYKTNKPYSRQWTHKRLNIANDNGKLGKRVDVAGAHSLRRTAGHNIYDKTKDLRYVQVLLGHDRIKQTEHYLKLDEKEGLEKLSRLYD
jgi:integrase